MAVEAIGSIMPEMIKLGKTEAPDKKMFDNVLTQFITDTNKSQLDSSKLVEDFASGKEVELHDVMIAGEKAKTNLQLLMEIRNKSVDMYKELTRDASIVAGINLNNNLAKYGMEVFNKLSMQQRVLLGGIVAVTLILLGVTIFFMNEPTYSTLYSNLAQEDASKVVETLTAQKFLTK